MASRLLLECFRNIRELYELVKCPICLDTVVKPYELRCNHRFCYNCFEEYRQSTTNVKCPVCKRIPRTKRDHNLNREKLEQYLFDVNKILSDELNSHLLELQNLEDIDEKLSIIMPILRKKKKNNCFCQETSAATKATTRTRNKFPENRIEDSSKISTSTSPIPFQRPLKTYYNRGRKTQSNEQKEWETSLTFTDNSNKLKIIAWLNDNKNEFNRQTLTESEKCDSPIDVDLLDMPSVSQNSQSINFPSKKKTGIDRPRSLDIQVEKMVPRLKSHSISDTNLNIIQNESVENAPVIAIIDLIENEFLDNLESELQKDKKKDQSGWDRMKDITSTLERTEPRKLDISHTKIGTSPNENDDQIYENATDSLFPELNPCEIALNTIQKTCAKISDESKIEFYKNIQNLFKSIKLHENAETQTELICSNQMVQTDVIGQKNVETQSAPISKCDIEIQTNQKTVVDETNQTDIVKNVDNYVQTDELFYSKSLLSFISSGEDKKCDEPDEKLELLKQESFEFIFETEDFLTNMKTQGDKKRKVTENEKPSDRFIDDNLSVYFDVGTEKSQEPPLKRSKIELQTEHISRRCLFVNTKENDQNLNNISKEIQILGKELHQVGDHLMDEPFPCENFDSDCDVIDPTPPGTPNRFSELTPLGITLPPPIEFRDTDNTHEAKKIRTSTPQSQKFASISSLDFSPISSRSKSKIPGSMGIIKQTNHSISDRNHLSPITNVDSPNSILNDIKISKPCLSGTRLKRDQIMKIMALCNRKLWTYSYDFHDGVTHLIVVANDRRQLEDRTMKYLQAIASGIWVVSFEWVEACLESNSLVPEEPFEVCDISGEPGAKMARLTNKNVCLLKKFKIFLAPPFISTTKAEIELVIKLAGGQVVEENEELLNKNGYICVILAEAKAVQNFEIFETWLEFLNVLTVDIHWLSCSIGQYKLLSFKPFTLCSDDMITQLGYPLELIEDTDITPCSQESDVTMI